MPGGQLILPGGGRAIGPNGGRVILGDAPCECCGGVGPCEYCGFVFNGIPTQAAVTISGVQSCNGCGYVAYSDGRYIASLSNASVNGTYVATQLAGIPDLQPIASGPRTLCGSIAPQPFFDRSTRHTRAYVNATCQQLDGAGWDSDTTCGRMRCSVNFGYDLGRPFVRAVVSPVGCVDSIFGNDRLAINTGYSGEWFGDVGGCLALNTVYVLTPNPDSLRECWPASGEFDFTERTSHRGGSITAVFS